MIFLTVVLYFIALSLFILWHKKPWNFHALIYCLNISLFYHCFHFATRFHIAIKQHHCFTQCHHLTITQLMLASCLLTSSLTGRNSQLHIFGWQFCCRRLDSYSSLFHKSSFRFFSNYHSYVFLVCDFASKSPHNSSTARNHLLWMPVISIKWMIQWKHQTSQCLNCCSNMVSTQLMHSRTFLI